MEVMEMHGTSGACGAAQGSIEQWKKVARGVSKVCGK